MRENFVDALMFMLEYELRKIWPKFRQRAINNFVKRDRLDFDNVCLFRAGVENRM